MIANDPDLIYLGMSALPVVIGVVTWLIDAGIRKSDAFRGHPMREHLVARSLLTNLGYGLLIAVDVWRSAPPGANPGAVLNQHALFVVAWMIGVGLTMRVWQKRARDAAENA